MSAKMLYQVLLSYLLYLSVYASPSKYAPRDVSEAQFPSLEEALVGVFEVQNGATVGVVSTGATLVANIITGGSVNTVEGFSGPQLVSVVDHGEDWHYVDLGGKSLRLNVRTLLKASNGDFLSFKYTGIIFLIPDIQTVLAGNGTVGNITITGGFETGSATYKELENSIFVGTGGLVFHEDQSITLTYGLSRVVG